MLIEHTCITQLTQKKKLDVNKMDVLQDDGGQEFVVPLLTVMRTYTP